MKFKSCCLIRSWFWFGFASRMQRWIGSLVGRTIARSSAGRRTITITTPVRWLRSDRRFSTAAGTKQTKQTKQQTATATTSAKDKGGDPSIRDSLFTLCKHRGFVYPVRVCVRTRCKWETARTDVLCARRNVRVRIFTADSQHHMIMDRWV